MLDKKAVFYNKLAQLKFQCNGCSNKFEYEDYIKHDWQCKNVDTENDEMEVDDDFRVKRIDHMLRMAK